MADILTFSTDAFVDSDKIPAWREVFGRSVVKMDMEPARGEPFRSKARIDCLPCLTIASIASTANRVVRTPQLVADGSDDLVFALMTKGEAMISQRRREVVFRAGEAVLWSNASPGVCDYARPIDFVALVVPRAQVAVADIDRSLMRLLPDDLGAMKLLSRYLSILGDGQLDGMTPALRALCATHLRDLVAVVVGATREAADVAKVRGVPAARLAALKADIVANITQRNLSADILAARHDISPVYVRKLFERDGTSLGQYVLEQRLDRAFRLLANPNPLDRSIGAVAFECGFGDLSYFNRSFRQRYGATPSDIRAGRRCDDTDALSRSPEEP
ncbi:helix-turn-helix domain-containing protein [Bradyrhizobium guangzhouense]|uniref:Helix-turn-helix domain-containing protein n=1 Tax=Bradyrhizobium guangzhouense TaxID=1325095 RepID=A0ABY0DZW8_9BRAD|nr:helix-turn-helix domain-containing protein [Bradyrhizobium guangzhouense]RXH07623.1 helix-turn-helix domain-containing protein [Bradyrhizobium guangzhouense]